MVDKKRKNPFSGNIRIKKAKTFSGTSVIDAKQRIYLEGIYGNDEIYQKLKGELDFSQINNILWHKYWQRFTSEAFMPTRIHTLRAAQAFRLPGDAKNIDINVASYRHIAVRSINVERFKNIINDLSQTNGLIPDKSYNNELKIRIAMLYFIAKKDIEAIKLLVSIIPKSIKNLFAYDIKTFYLPLIVDNSKESLALIDYLISLGANPDIPTIDLDSNNCKTQTYKTSVAVFAENGLNLCLLHIVNEHNAALNIPCIYKIVKEKKPEYISYFSDIGNLAITFPQELGSQVPFISHIINRFSLRKKTLNSRENYNKLMAETIRITGTEKPEDLNIWIYTIHEKDRFGNYPLNKLFIISLIASYNDQAIVLDPENYNVLGPISNDRQKASSVFHILRYLKSGQNPGEVKYFDFFLTKVPFYFNADQRNKYHNSILNQLYIEYNNFRNSEKFSILDFFKMRLDHIIPSILYVFNCDESKLQFINDYIISQKISFTLYSFIKEIAELDSEQLFTEKDKYYTVFKDLFKEFTTNPELIKQAFMKFCEIAYEYKGQQDIAKLDFIQRLVSVKTMSIHPDFQELNSKTYPIGRRETAEILK